MAGVPHANVVTSSETRLPGSVRSSLFRRDVRLAEANGRDCGTLTPTPQPALANALVRPTRKGELEMFSPKSCQPTGSGLPTRPSAGRVSHVTAPSAHESSGRKTA